MTRCAFVSDLHGREARYRALFRFLCEAQPDALFLGGDLLPRGADAERFLDDLLEPALRSAGASADDRTRVFLLLGNDDPAIFEDAARRGEERGAWTYLHARRAQLAGRAVYGYACVPPTPFLLKDWERYDVSRHTDPGCVSPEEGWRTVPVAANEVRHGTIARDLDRLAGDDDLSGSVWLFHSPPWNSHLDRAALDGMTDRGVPLDLHVGSIAIRRFLERRPVHLALHGHIHESARLTGAWHDRVGQTLCLSAAHDGPELALVQFPLEAPGQATRTLL